MKIPGLTTLKRITLKPVEGLVGSLVKDLLTRFFSSALKSLAAVLIAALGAFAGVPLPTDPQAAWVWGFVLVGVRALIAVIEQFLRQLPEIIAAAKAASKQ